MTREIILDTETTGLETSHDHRIIEIGAVEMIDRRLTGKYFHEYLDPEREVDAGASRVHGFTWEALKGKPKFADVADRLVDFIDGGELVIHNAPFDMGFLAHEFAKLDRAKDLERAKSVTDTLKMARALYPGKRNNLDALCERYGVDRSGRTFHGALLDAQLLADVYLAMTRGQESLAIELVVNPGDVQSELLVRPAHLKVLRASLEDEFAHEAYLAKMEQETKTSSVWRQYLPA